MTERKTKTCGRCKGRGLVGSPVVHCGVPGGCYDCNLSGVLRWYTKEELEAAAVKVKASHLAEIEARGAYIKAKLERVLQRGSSVVLAAQLTESLESERALWLKVKNTPVSVKAGKWLA